MAKSAAERRATRKRKEQERGRRRPSVPGDARGRADSDDLIGHLVVAAAATGDAREFAAITEELARRDAGVDSAGHATRLLIGLIGQLWESGWQPTDLAHVVRRSESQRLVRLLIAGIAEEARASGAPTRAPEEWTAQLAALGAMSSARPDVVATWAGSERLTATEAWRDALRLIGPLGDLTPLQVLVPPPSRWGRTPRPTRTTSRTAADARVLNRIRGLLAKAESTEFPEEAEALSAKAQELMTRYAVDHALLDAEQGRSVTDLVAARRVHLDNPYPEPKARLLSAVGKANGVRVIWLEWVGMATIVGLPDDLDAVDLLFTSLLVQATRAMAATGRADGGRSRSPSFRRAFLTSYAVRIGERLTEAREHAVAEAARGTGRDLVPVLRKRDQAVDDVFARMFPETYGTEGRAYDARGWHAGRLAADSADLGTGREQLHA
jgi:hypothetical protein